MVICFVTLSGSWPSKFGQPKVQHFDQPAVVHHDVGGLQVAVYDAGSVRARQSLGDLNGIVEGSIGCQASRRNQLVQRLPATYSITMKSTPP